MPRSTYCLVIKVLYVPYCLVSLILHVFIAPHKSDKYKKINRWCTVNLAWEPGAGALGEPGAGAWGEPQAGAWGTWGESLRGYPGRGT
jgi:hypothetical protein